MNRRRKQAIVDLIPCTAKCVTWRRLEDPYEKTLTCGEFSFPQDEGGAASSATASDVNLDQDAHTAPDFHHLIQFSTCFNWAGLIK